MLKNEKRTLSCDLSDEEVREYSNDLARLTSSISELEEEKKNTASNYGNKISTQRSQTKELARKISTKKELREVHCENFYDWPDGLVITTRQDTMQVIDTEPIPEWERQQHLDLENKEEGEEEEVPGAEGSDEKPDQDQGDGSEGIDPEAEEDDETVVPQSGDAGEGLQDVEEEIKESDSSDEKEVF